MKLVAIPVAGATENALEGAETAGTAAMDLECEDVESGGTITPMENKCYKLVFDQANAQSTYTVDAASAGAIAFFAEHLPTEFENTDHYFKDTSPGAEGGGVDIEPTHQVPDEGDGHSHGGAWSDEFEGMCVCQAAKHGWQLDCSKKAKISEAVANLEKKAACKAKGPPKDCEDNYYVMQAHHDHCLHDKLPSGIEKKLHDYEHFYTDCFVKRQFNAKLTQCAKVTCTDSVAMTNAIVTLKACAKTKAACAATACAAAVKVVLMAHDTCSEKQLPTDLETALHDYEEPCEDELCNSAAAAFDPYATKCSASTVSSGGFGSQDSLLVTTFALPLAALLFF